MLIKFSAKKPLTIIVIVILIIVFGMVSVTRMTPNLFPNIDLPYVAIMTNYTGATPEEVESTVTKPLEEQVATLEKLKGTQSISFENFSTVFLEFENGADLGTVSSDIRDKIDLIRDAWNDRVENPVIFKVNPEMVPLNVSAVTMDDKSTAQLSDLLEEELERKLEGTDGVAGVSTAGAVDNMINVKLSQKKIDRCNDKIKNAIDAKLGSAMGQASSGLAGIAKAQKQITNAKSRIKNAQKSLAKNSESISQALGAINDAVIQRDIAKAAGDSAKAALIQTQIDAMKQQLEPMKKQLKTMGIDLDKIDESSTTSMAAVSTFNIYKANSFSNLSNQMSELTAKEAELSGAKNQITASLSGMSAGSSGSMNLNNILTIANVSAIISSQNFDMPAGYISEDGREMMVSVGDKIEDMAELKDLVVFNLGMAGVEEVRLSDVATVSYTSGGEKTYAKINGKEGILLSLTKQSDYSTTEASDNIKENFAQLEEEYEGLHFITLSDQGKYIYVVLDSLANNLLVGALLAILILIFFLRSWRPTFISVISIPVSLTFALALMYFSGVTLNIISLSGLAVGIGMLVDNSIIVMENIYRLRALGYSKVQAAVSGTRQIMGAITASTLTTVCVFVPIVFVQGITREIFTDMALTIAYALFASLLIAVTFVPAMSTIMVDKVGQKTVMSADSPTVEWYSKILRKVLDNKKKALALSLVLLIASSGIVLAKGFEYMPPMATQEITGTVELDSEVTPEESMAFGDEVEAKIQKIDGVETVGIMLESDVNSTMMSMGERDWSRLNMYVLLDEEEISKNPVVSKKITKICKESGAEDSLISGDMDMTSMTALGGGGINVKLYGDDLDELRTAAIKTEDGLKEMRGIEDLSDSNEESVDELHISVHKNAAMMRGFTVAEVYQQVAAAISKEQYSTGIIYEDMERDVTVSSGRADKMNQKSLRNLLISKTDPATGETKSVKLGKIASIGHDKALSSITHLNQKRALSVTGAIKEGYNSTKVTDAVEDKVETLSLPDSVSVEYGGEDEAIMDAMKQLVEMMLLGILIIYLIMVAQFQSFKSPLIIMATVLLGFTGGFLALLLTFNDMSVISMVGFIVLMGVIVNNGIVLVDYINKRRLEGEERRYAIVEACKTRIRPVCMTALTTILALIPMALGIGSGTEMMQPVAIVCIGGLLYATATTLLVVPALYEILNKKEMKAHEEREFELIDE